MVNEKDILGLRVLAVHESQKNEFRPEDSIDTSVLIRHNL